ncbi:MAG: CRISPR-associated ring nuclease Crn3/Csx3 [Candidatus Odinarchaeum yellowstonii]|uniref:CRISPR-associated ring nuclease Crn3/Csx3 n=1 Tax=Odinarchaeota yellowstonii (strain LCB_4) TaxID=1841599 RepID=A0AAF0D232_ODILC|nr:MAG: CRISPR-associated ring nuclease Crn3/Csx3 [Candidatus Odinarchaeum yellowstonii]
MRFNTFSSDNWTIVSFELDGVIAPDDLKRVSPPEVNNSKGVILSGRGPIWLYCFLTHFYHPALFIATHDPRLGGAVVVESHSPSYQIGDVIKLEVV